MKTKIDLKKTPSILTITMLLISTIAFIGIPITSVSADPGTTTIRWVEANVNGTDGTEADPWGNITWALNHVTDDDVIKVKPGEYNTTIGETFPLRIVNDNVTLESTGGAAATNISGSGGAMMFHLARDDVTIDGFTFKGDGTDHMGIYGSSGGYTIRNNKFIDIVGGANINLDSAVVAITSGTIDNNTFIGSANSAAAISAPNAFDGKNYSGVTISNNIISNFTGDVGIQPSSVGSGRVNDLTITGNTVTDSARGFYPWQAWGDNMTVTDNTFSRCRTGIKINYGTPTNLNITGNNIANNTEMGIQIFNWSDTNVIYYNNIYNNTLYGLSNTNGTSVNATLNWWGSATGPGYTGGSAGGLGTGNNVSANVHYTPWLNAAYPGGVSTTPFTITPTATKGNVQKWFNITVQNIGSPAAVDYVNVSYPSSFTLHTYNYPTGWTQSHDMSGKTVTFAATGGYQLDISESGRFNFKMTTSSSSDDYKILCKNLMGGMGYQNLTISVDATPPTVTLSTLPTYYSVGGGNRIYINGTINDNTYSTPSLAINDTTHFPTNPQVLTYNATATSYTWYFRFYNTSAVADGHLAVNVTGTDAAGNVESGGNVGSTTIDNTAPTLISLVVQDDVIGNLTSVGNTYYMSGTATGLNFTIMFNEAHPHNNVTYIYNGTGTTTKTFQNNTWFYSEAQNWYNVTGINTVTISNITITDVALPNNNTLTTSSYTVTRDQVGPTVPTYTVTEICGGLIIKNLNATDNVGVLRYEVYVNGTSFLNVTATTLANTTLDWVTGALNTSCVFDGTLVLNLTNYAGGHANLTVRAVDLGGNTGNFSTPAVYTIAEERWYPIELQVNWNLISLPLIPASTARADVLSMILKQGATGVRFIYGYNNNTDAWVLNPSTMEDGMGYWINMEAYDVLIVSGRISAEPPALPPNYYFTTGWVLAGYKSINTRNVATYLSSLPNATYFKYIYAWDATTQSWNMLDRENAAHNLSPGMGFWIWMYSDETLIPPIP